jgi:uncharacterized protein YjbI with pentapeptide repeats
MANKQHLKILKQGVALWNAWRTEHPEITPDLNKAEVGKARLIGVNFKAAKLSGAELDDADLSGADLESAYLYGAYLERVNLTGANLRNARLNSAELADADLRGAVLNGASLDTTTLTRALLHKADFSNAYLGGAILINAQMDEADLSDANLRNAKLQNASLRGAFIHRATFNNSKLYQADLSGALIYGTTFDETELTGTNFADTQFGENIFADIDFRGAIGLESVLHRQPSEIGTNTIFLSEGQIPEKFLIGCGLPEEYIVQIPALVSAMQPIQFYSCFISYSSRDEQLAQRLYADLQSKGVRCWFAPEDLKIGERFRRRIDEVIRVHDKLLLIISEHSVASSWVEKEVETAMESEDDHHRTVLFPVRLDDSVMEIKEGWPADVRRTRHIGDFRRWKEHDEYQKAFARLLADLKASV